MIRSRTRFLRMTLTNWWLIKNGELIVHQYRILMHQDSLSTNYHTYCNNSCEHFNNFNDILNDFSWFFDHLWWLLWHFFTICMISWLFSLILNDVYENSRFFMNIVIKLHEILSFLRFFPVLMTIPTIFMIFMEIFNALI